MKPKSIFKSRTALLAFLTALAGVVGCISDGAGQFIRDHAAAILLLIGMANVWLRRITHGQVTFLPKIEDEGFPGCP